MSSLQSIWLGQSEVGKTSLLLAGCNSHQRHGDYRYPPTTGVDALLFSQLGRRLMCWDTSGQARFEMVVSMFLKHCDVAVIVYDLQNPSSFDTAVQWHRRVQSYCASNSSTIRTYLVGNKMDAESKMAPERVETYCQEHRLEHFKMESSDTAAVQRFLRYIVDCDGGPRGGNACCTIT